MRSTLPGARRRGLGDHAFRHACFQQDFAAVRALLDETQRTTWDAALGALLNARRAPVYKLVDGTPQMAVVRIGASDGTDTEISGNVQEGDELVTGERAAQAATPAAP